MAVYYTTISEGTTGVKTITPGFQPQEADITVSSQFGTTNTTLKYSYGSTDGTAQFNDSLFVDGTGRQCRSTTDRIVSVYERISGTLTEVLRVNLDSFTATQFKYNVSIANVNYQLKIRIRG